MIMIGRSTEGSVVRSPLRVVENDRSTHRLPVRSPSGAALSINGFLKITTCSFDLLSTDGGKKREAENAEYISKRAFLSFITTTQLMNVQFDRMAFITVAKK